MPIIAAAIIGGTALAGSAYSASQASSAAGVRNRQQMAMTQQQMDWEEKMRSTAHQAEVADLKAAGLNPILSGTGGAGASWHSVAPAQIESEFAPVDAGGAVQAGVSAYGVAKQNELLESQKNLLDWQTEKTKQEARSEMIDADNKQAERAWWTSDPEHENEVEYPERAYSKRQAQQFEAKFGMTLEEAKQKIQGTQKGGLDIKVRRQELAKLVQDLQIGGSAVARSKVLKRIYEADESELLVLSEQIGGAVGQITGGSFAAAHSARGLGSGLSLPSLKGKFPGAFPDDYGR